MKPLIYWLDQRTGLLTSFGNWLQRPIAGGPAWRFVWPTTIAFALAVQAITGLVLWMYFSAGAQSSWESVYYLQYQVIGGWLLRALHFYMGQATLVLVGIYLVQMIVRADYRAPREFLYWTVLLMGLVTLGLNLTGDLLSWDQNSYWATSIRTAYLSHMPVVGPWLCKLAIGGPEFGTLTITRFLALHAGACTAALLLLILLHAHLAARASSAVRGNCDSVPYWPQQACRDAAACLVVLAVVAALSASHGVRSPHAGVELGAPANPVEDPGTARPEWSFRGLYQLHESLSGWPEMVSIFAIPGLTVLLFFAMPWIGKNLAGRALNVVLTLLVLGGLGVLTWQSYAGDAKNVKYQAALQEGHELAQRVKELAESSQKIPVSGALTLLRGDAKIQGPRLFNQHCASCHAYSGESLVSISRPEKPTAADLHGFASLPWLTEFFKVDVKAVPKYYGIATDRFFGNTKFKQKKMYGFIKETFSDYEPAERQQVIHALSHEAALKSQAEADSRDKAAINAGSKFIAENCTECHTFHGKGTASGPDLTGYGSRDWLMGVVGNPAHKRFYGKENDRMPAFAESTTDPKKNVLSRQEIELLVDWLRGEWYEPTGP
jgi:ubiquinol-cytochrome c reductase cytochrome b subunit